MPHPISRRDLLTLTAAGALGAAAGGAPPAAAAAAAPVVLTVGRRTLEVDGRAASVFAIRQPDGQQGLVTSIATPFRVDLRNDCGEPTLIHWHGLTPPSRQDGVPGLSAPALPPGASASYDFPLAFSGTFWMHSHQGLQEQSLMSAPLIIHDAAAPRDEQEVVLMLHDFAFRSPQEIFAGLRGKAGMPNDDSGGGGGRMMMTMDLNDVAFDAFLANDRTLADPEVVRVAPGGRVWLRIINAAAASGFSITLGGMRATLVAVDGHPVQPMTGSRFPLAMAQRLDLLIDLPRGRAAVPVLAVLEGARAQTGIILATAGARVEKRAAQAATAAPPLDFAAEAALRAARPLAPRAPDRVLRVDLTGSMHPYVWSLNGRTYGQDTGLKVSQGERVELVMTNRTMMSHPMHLHGHVFQVVAGNDKRFSGAIRDTVLVPPMMSVTVAFDADNPGRWAFHCHNLYHMHAGMMTTLDYSAA